MLVILNFLAEITFLILAIVICVRLNKCFDEISEIRDFLIRKNYNITVDTLTVIPKSEGDYKMVEKIFLNK
jgi:hypothetical protein